jgi:hypothetical protein
MVTRFASATRLVAYLRIVFGALSGRPSRRSTTKLLDYLHSVITTSYSVAEERLADGLQRFSSNTGVQAACGRVCEAVALLCCSHDKLVAYRNPETVARRRMLLNGLTQLATAAGYVPMSRSEAHVRPYCRLYWLLCELIGVCSWH